MQELFFTILAIWILFRILNNSSERKIVNVFYQKSKPEEQRAEGETKIVYAQNEKKKQKSSSEDDYVDFEEIK